MRWSDLRGNSDIPGLAGVAERDVAPAVSRDTFLRYAKEWDLSQDEQMPAAFSADGKHLVLGSGGMSGISVPVKVVGPDPDTGLTRLNIAGVVVLADVDAGGSVRLPFGGGAKQSLDPSQALMVPGMAGLMAGHGINFMLPGEPAHALVAGGKQMFDRGIRGMSPQMQADLQIPGVPPGKVLAAGASAAASIPVSAGAARLAQGAGSALTGGKWKPSPEFGQAVSGAAMVGGEAQGELHEQGRDSLTSGLVPGLVGAITERRIKGLSELKLRNPAQEAAAEVIQEGAIKGDVVAHGGEMGDPADFPLAALGGIMIGTVFAANQDEKERAHRFLRGEAQKVLDEYMKGEALQSREQLDRQARETVDQAIRGALERHGAGVSPGSSVPGDDAVQDAGEQVYVGGSRTNTLPWPEGTTDEVKDKVLEMIRQRLKAEWAGRFDSADPEKDAALFEDWLAWTTIEMTHTEAELDAREPLEGVPPDKMELGKKVVRQMAGQFMGLFEEMVGPQGLNVELPAGETPAQRADRRRQEYPVDEGVIGGGWPPPGPVQGGGGAEQAVRMQKVSAHVLADLARRPGMEGADQKQLQDYVAAGGLALQRQFSRADWDHMGDTELDEVFGTNRPFREIGAGKWKAEVKEIAERISKNWNTLDDDPADYQDAHRHPDYGKPFGEQGSSVRRRLRDGKLSLEDVSKGEALIKRLNSRAARAALGLDHVKAEDAPQHPDAMVMAFDRPQAGQGGGRQAYRSVNKVAQVLAPELSNYLNAANRHRVPGSKEGKPEEVLAQARQAVASYREGMRTLLAEMGQEDQEVMTWDDFLLVAAHSGKAEALAKPLDDMALRYGTMVSAVSAAVARQVQEIVDTSPGPETHEGMAVSMADRTRSGGQVAAIAETMNAVAPDVTALLKEVLEMVANPDQRKGGLRPVLHHMVAESLKVLDLNEHVYKDRDGAIEGEEAGARLEELLKVVPLPEKGLKDEEGMRRLMREFEGNFKVLLRWDRIEGKDDALVAYRNFLARHKTWPPSRHAALDRLALGVLIQMHDGLLELEGGTNINAAIGALDLISDFVKQGLPEQQDGGVQGTPPAAGGTATGGTATDTGGGTATDTGTATDSELADALRALEDQLWVIQKGGEKIDLRKDSEDLDRAGQNATYILQFFQGQGEFVDVARDEFTEGLQLLGGDEFEGNTPEMDIAILEATQTVIAGMASFLDTMKDAIAEHDTIKENHGYLRVMSQMIGEMIKAKGGAQAGWGGDEGVQGTPPAAGGQAGDGGAQGTPPAAGGQEGGGQEGGQEGGGQQQDQDNGFPVLYMVGSDEQYHEFMRAYVPIYVLSFKDAKYREQVLNHAETDDFQQAITMLESKMRAIGDGTEWAVTDDRYSDIHNTMVDIVNVIKEKGTQENINKQIRNLDTLEALANYHFAAVEAQEAAEADKAEAPAPMEIANDADYWTRLGEAREQLMTEIEDGKKKRKMRKSWNFLEKGDKFTGDVLKAPALVEIHELLEEMNIDELPDLGGDVEMAQRLNGMNIYFKKRQDGMADPGAKPADEGVQGTPPAAGGEAGGAQGTPPAAGGEAQGGGEAGGGTAAADSTAQDDGKPGPDASNKVILDYVTRDIGNWVFDGGANTPKKWFNSIGRKRGDKARRHPTRGLQDVINDLHSLGKLSDEIMESTKPIRDKIFTQGHQDELDSTLDFKSPGAIEFRDLLQMVESFYRGEGIDTLSEAQSSQAWTLGQNIARADEFIKMLGEEKGGVQGTPPAAGGQATDGGKEGDSGSTGRPKGVGEATVREITSPLDWHTNVRENSGPISEVIGLYVSNMGIPLEKLQGIYETLSDIDSGTVFEFTDGRIGEVQEFFGALADKVNDDAEAREKDPNLAGMGEALRKLADYKPAEEEKGGDGTGGTEGDGVQGTPPGEEAKTQEQMDKEWVDEVSANWSKIEFIEKRTGTKELYPLPKSQFDSAFDTIGALAKAGAFTAEMAFQQGGMLIHPLLHHFEKVINVPGPKAGIVEQYQKLLDYANERLGLNKDVGEEGVIGTPSDYERDYPDGKRDHYRDVKPGTPPPMLSNRPTEMFLPTIPLKRAGHNNLLDDPTKQASPTGDPQLAMPHGYPNPYRMPDGATYTPSVELIISDAPEKTPKDKDDYHVTKRGNYMYKGFNYQIKVNAVEDPRWDISGYAVQLEPGVGEALPNNFFVNSYMKYDYYQRGPAINRAEIPEHLDITGISHPDFGYFAHSVRFNNFAEYTAYIESAIANIVSGGIPADMTLSAYGTPLMNSAIYGGELRSLHLIDPLVQGVNATEEEGNAQLRQQLEEQDDGIAGINIYENGILHGNFAPAYQKGGHNNLRIVPQNMPRFPKDAGDISERELAKEADHVVFDYVNDKIDGVDSDWVSMGGWSVRFKGNNERNTKYQTSNQLIGGDGLSRVAARRYMLDHETFVRYGGHGMLDPRRFDIVKWTPELDPAYLPLAQVKMGVSSIWQPLTHLAARIFDDSDIKGYYTVGIEVNTDAHQAGIAMRRPEHSIMDNRWHIVVRDNEETGEMELEQIYHPLYGGRHYKGTEFQASHGATTKVMHEKGQFTAHERMRDIIESEVINIMHARRVKEGRNARTRWQAMSQPDDAPKKPGDVPYISLGYSVSLTKGKDDDTPEVVSDAPVPNMAYMPPGRLKTGNTRIFGPGRRWVFGSDKFHAKHLKDDTETGRDNFGLYPPNTRMVRIMVDGEYADPAPGESPEDTVFFEKHGFAFYNLDFKTQTLGHLDGTMRLNSLEFNPYFDKLTGYHLDENMMNTRGLAMVYRMADGKVKKIAFDSMKVATHIAGDIRVANQPLSQMLTALLLHAREEKVDDKGELIPPNDELSIEHGEALTRIGSKKPTKVSKHLDLGKKLTKQEFAFLKNNTSTILAWIGNVKTIDKSGYNHNQPFFLSQWASYVPYLFLPQFQEHYWNNMDDTTLQVAQAMLRRIMVHALELGIGMWQGWLNPDQFNNPEDFYKWFTEQTKRAPPPSGPTGDGGKDQGTTAPPAQAEEETPMQRIAKVADKILHAIDEYSPNIKAGQEKAFDAMRDTIKKVKAGKPVPLSNEALQNAAGLMTWYVKRGYLKEDGPTELEFQALINMIKGHREKQPLGETMGIMASRMVGAPGGYESGTPMRQVMGSFIDFDMDAEGENDPNKGKEDKKPATGTPAEGTPAEGTDPEDQATGKPTGETAQALENVARRVDPAIPPRPHVTGPPSEFLAPFKKPPAPRGEPLIEMTQAGSLASRTHWKDVAEKLFQAALGYVYGQEQYEFSGVFKHTARILGGEGEIDVGDSPALVARALADTMRTLRRVINSDPGIRDVVRGVGTNPDMLARLMEVAQEAGKRIKHLDAAGRNGFERKVPTPEAAVIIGLAAGPGKGLNLLNDTGGVAEALTTNTIATHDKNRSQPFREAVYAASRGMSRGFIERGNKFYRQKAQSDENAVFILEETPIQAMNEMWQIDSDRLHTITSNLAFMDRAYAPAEFDNRVNSELEAVKNGANTYIALIRSKDAKAIVGRVMNDSKLTLVAHLQAPEKWQWIVGAGGVDMMIVTRTIPGLSPNETRAVNMRGDYTAADAMRNLAVHPWMGTRNLIHDGPGIALATLSYLARESKGKLLSPAVNEMDLMKYLGITNEHFVDQAGHLLHNKGYIVREVADGGLASYRLTAAGLAFQRALEGRLPLGANLLGSQEYDQHGRPMFDARPELLQYLDASYMMAVGMDAEIPDSMPQARAYARTVMGSTLNKEAWHQAKYYTIEQVRNNVDNVIWADPSEQHEGRMGRAVKEGDPGWRNLPLYVHHRFIARGALAKIFGDFAAILPMIIGGYEAVHKQNFGYMLSPNQLLERMGDSIAISKYDILLAGLLDRSLVRTGHPHPDFSPGFGMKRDKDGNVSPGSWSVENATNRGEIIRKYWDNVKHYAIRNINLISGEVPKERAALGKHLQNLKDNWEGLRVDAILQDMASVGLGRYDQETGVFQMNPGIIERNVDMNLLMDYNRIWNEDTWQEVQGAVLQGKRNSLRFLLTTQGTRAENPDAPLNILKESVLIQGVENGIAREFSRRLPDLRTFHEMASIMREKVVDLALQDYADLPSHQRGRDDVSRDKAMTQLLADRFMDLLGLARADMRLSHTEQYLAHGNAIKDTTDVKESEGLISLWGQAPGMMALPDKIQQHLPKARQIALSLEGLNYVIRNIVEISRPTSGYAQEDVGTLVGQGRNYRIHEQPSRGDGPVNQAAVMLGNGVDKGEIMDWINNELARRGMVYDRVSYGDYHYIFKDEREELLALGRFIQAVENYEDVLNRGRTGEARLLLGGYYKDAEKQPTAVIFVQENDDFLGVVDPAANVIAIRESGPYSALAHEMAHLISFSLTRSPGGQPWMDMMKFALAARIEPEKHLENVRIMSGLGAPIKPITVTSEMHAQEAEMLGGMAAEIGEEPFIPTQTHGRFAVPRGTRKGANDLFRMKAILLKVAKEMPELSIETLKEYLDEWTFADSQFMLETERIEVLAKMFFNTQGISEAESLTRSKRAMEIFQGLNGVRDLEAHSRGRGYLVSWEEMWARTIEQHVARVLESWGRSDKLLVPPEMASVERNILPSLQQRHSVPHNYHSSKEQAEAVDRTLSLFFDNLHWDGGYQIRDKKFSPLMLGFAGLSQNDLVRLGEEIDNEARLVGEMAGMTSVEMDIAHMDAMESVAGLTVPVAMEARPPEGIKATPLGSIQEGAPAVTLGEVTKQGKDLASHPGEPPRTKSASGTLGHYQRSWASVGNLPINAAAAYFMLHPDELKKDGLNYWKQPSSLQYTGVASAILGTSKVRGTMGYSRLLYKYDSKTTDDSSLGQRTLTRYLQEQRDHIAATAAEDDVIMELQQLIDDQNFDRNQLIPDGLRQFMDQYKGNDAYALTMDTDKIGMPILTNKSRDTDRLMTALRQAYLAAWSTGLGKTMIGQIYLDAVNFLGNHQQRSAVLIMPKPALYNQTSSDSQEAKINTPVFLTDITIARFNRLVNEGMSEQEAAKATFDYFLEATKLSSMDFKEVHQWMVGETHGVSTAFSPMDDIVSPLAAPNRQLTKDSKQSAWDAEFDQATGNAWMRHHYSQYNATLFDGKVTDRTIALHDKLLGNIDAAHAMLKHLKKEFKPRAKGEISQVVTFLALTGSDRPHEKIQVGDVITIRLKRRKGVTNETELIDSFRHPKKGELLDLKPNRRVLINYDQLSMAKTVFDASSTVFPALIGHDGPIVVDEAHTLGSPISKDNQNMPTFVNHEDPKDKISGEEWAELAPGMQAQYKRKKGDGANIERLVVDTSKDMNILSAIINDLTPNSRVLYLTATPAEKEDEIFTFARAMGTGIMKVRGKDGNPKVIIAPSGLDAQDMQGIVGTFQHESSLSSYMRSMTTDGLAAALDAESKTKIDVQAEQVTDKEQAQIERLVQIVRTSVNDYLRDAAELALQKVKTDTVQTLQGKIYQTVVVNRGSGDSQKEFHVERQDYLDMMLSDYMSKDAKMMVDLNKWVTAQMKSKFAADKIADNVDHQKFILHFEIQNAEGWEKAFKRYEKGENIKLTKFIPVLHFLRHLMPADKMLPTLDKTGAVKISSTSKGQEERMKNSVLMDRSAINRRRFKWSEDKDMMDLRESYLNRIHDQLIEELGDLRLDHLPGAIAQRLGKKVEYKDKYKRKRVKWVNHGAGILSETNYWVYTLEDGISVDFLRRDDQVEKDEAKDKFQFADVHRGWDIRKDPAERAKDLKEIRQQWADRFKTREELGGRDPYVPMRVLLLSAKTGGVGVNLHNIDGMHRTLLTTDVPWQAKASMQVMGRHARTGEQDTGDTIFYFYDNNVTDYRLAVSLVKKIIALSGMSTGDTRSDDNLGAVLKKQTVIIDRTALRSAIELMEKLPLIISDEEIAERFNLTQYHEVHERALEDAETWSEEEKNHWRAQGVTTPKEYARRKAMLLLYRDMGYTNEWQQRQNRLDNKLPSPESIFDPATQLADVPKLLNRLSYLSFITGKGLMDLIQVMDAVFRRVAESASPLPSQEDMDKAKGRLDAQYSIGDIDGTPAEFIQRTYIQGLPPMPFEQLSRYGSINDTAIVDREDAPMVIIDRDPLGLPFRNEGVLVARGSHFSFLSRRNFERRFDNVDRKTAGVANQLVAAVFYQGFRSAVAAFNKKYGVNITISQDNSRSALGPDMPIIPQIHVTGFREGQREVFRKFIQEEMAEEGKFINKTIAGKIVDAMGRIQRTRLKVKDKVNALAEKTRKFSKAMAKLNDELSKDDKVDLSEIDKEIKANPNLGMLSELTPGSSLFLPANLRDIIAKHGGVGYDALADEAHRTSVDQGAALVAYRETLKDVYGKYDNDMLMLMATLQSPNQANRWIDDVGGLNEAINYVYMNSTERLKLPLFFDDEANKTAFRTGATEAETFFKITHQMSSFKMGTYEMAKQFINDLPTDLRNERVATSRGANENLAHNRDSQYFRSWGDTWENFSGHDDLIRQAQMLEGAQVLANLVAQFAESEYSFRTKTEIDEETRDANLDLLKESRQKIRKFQRDPNDDDAKAGAFRQVPTEEIIADWNARYAQGSTIQTTVAGISGVHPLLVAAAYRRNKDKLREDMADKLGTDQDMGIHKFETRDIVMRDGKRVQITILPSGLMGSAVSGLLPYDIPLENTGRLEQMAKELMTSSLPVVLFSNDVAVLPHAFQSKISGYFKRLEEADDQEGDVDPAAEISASRWNINSPSDLRVYKGGLSDDWMKANNFEESGGLYYSKYWLPYFRLISEQRQLERPGSIDELRHLVP